MTLISLITINVFGDNIINDNGMSNWNRTSSEKAASQTSVPFDIISWDVWLMKITGNETTFKTEKQTQTDIKLYVQLL